MVDNLQWKEKEITMAYGKTMKKAPAKKTAAKKKPPMFKPCKGCPTPTACAKAKRCKKKGK